MTAVNSKLIMESVVTDMSLSINHIWLSVCVDSFISLCFYHIWQPCQLDLV